MASFIPSPTILPRHILSRQQQQLSCSQLPHSSTPTPPQSRPESQTPSPSLPTKQQPQPQLQPVTKTAADSTDWIASSLTRRFGLGAGLAWVGFLAVGVVSEQIKTRLEVSRQEANTKNVDQMEEVQLPNGIRYYEMRVGGGATPRTGDLVVIDLKGTVIGNDGGEFVNTFADGERPLALVMGSRPYTKGMCEGVEYVLRSMRAGGKRTVVVPPELAFGDEGADLGSGIRIPPAATLEFVVQVDRVSIAPA
ncbi:peptidyl-prolyl cis-trans isomerase FKBP17-2, chloroplastic [Iris pallida]|uniref:peptidylprolyl isomerase n=1 Tax=Iris pallida TaxID=29817 RepID=A0AAX6FKC2_IRIPA|nr:peptidyl-prolyl cis-trans isomerase FKBP17-2, chloroplastic [Iris pallida]